MSATYLILICVCINFVYCGEKSPEILIIGSGPSGIAAATKLWKANITNLKILEAEPRIGGRINSVKFGDAYIDLGAEWCHGEDGNAVYEMVKQYNILKHSTVSLKLIYSNGSYLDGEIFKNLENYFKAVDGFVTNPEIEESCKGLESVGACITKTFNPTFTKLYKNDPEKLNITLNALDWLQSFILSYDSAFSVDDLSRESDYEACDGDQALTWEGHGYKTILEVMMQKYPDPSKKLPIEDNILLNKEVTKIIWNNEDGKVSVECSDKSSFKADHVIFTPSLGVLKANYETMFQPGLPEAKINAIKTTGFGAVMKIALEFTETWWNTDEVVSPVWSPEDKNRILTEYGKGPVKDGVSWLITLAAFYTAENNPKVMMFYFSGNMIPEMEKEDDQSIKDGCMYLLKKFFAHKHTISEPVNIVRSNWYSNPHFRGTYSYDSVKGNSAQHKFPDKLVAPLTLKNGVPVVQFAGEATHPHHFSTVHGAIETGYREAIRITDLYTRE